MEKTEWFAIVNPVAGSGRGLADWPVISRLLRERGIIPAAVFTEHRHHATELTVQAIAGGYRKIIVVGGDGTIHEVVNGLFIQQSVPTQDVLLSVIAVGTGNDWIRMFGIPRRYSEAIRAIVEGHSFLQDVGAISYYESGYRQTRYMANVAGIGFDAFVNRKYNQLRDEGKFNRRLYIWSTLKSVLRYKSTEVKVWIDGRVAMDGLVYSATVGIGKYNGGGMMQMPQAIADDGLLDITVIRNISTLGVLGRFRALYNGKIYKIRKVSFDRGRRIKIESVPPIRVEVDGEALGCSPFEFDIIDRAVRVVVSEKFLKEDVRNRGGDSAV